MGLGSHTKAAQEAFERVAAAPEVVECHNATGTLEYRLRVAVADLAAYKRFHTDVLGTLPQVSAITSYVVMGSPKDERAWPYPSTTARQCTVFPVSCQAVVPPSILRLAPVT